MNDTWIVHWRSLKHLFSLNEKLHTSPLLLSLISWMASPLCSISASSVVKHLFWFAASHCFPILHKSLPMSPDVPGKLPQQLPLGCAYNLVSGKKIAVWNNPVMCGIYHDISQWYFWPINIYSPLQWEFCMDFCQMSPTNIIIIHQSFHSFNGHFRNLNWRYLPCIRPIFQAYVREYPSKIWPNVTSILGSWNDHWLVYGIYIYIC